MSNNVVAIASVEAEDEIRKLGDDASLEDRARAAMRGVRDSWIATREEEQYLAACEALARSGSPEERERVIEEVRRQRKAVSLINALQSGIPVDWEAIEEGDDDDFEPIGLQTIWREVCRG